MKVPFDLFFFPAIYSYFPIFNRAKIALTIHDMIPAAFPASVFPSRKLEYFWNLKEKAALWQADRIVTVSDYSRKQIVKLRGVPEEKIGIVSEGPGESFQLLPAGEERRKKPFRRAADSRGGGDDRRDDRHVLFSRRRRRGAQADHSTARYLRARRSHGEQHPLLQLQAVRGQKKVSGLAAAVRYSIHYRLHRGAGDHVFFLFSLVYSLRPSLVAPNVL